MEIDVSKCKYYLKKNKMDMCKACNSGVGTPYCEYDENCYYKQLQQLKAENEALTEQLDAEMLKTTELVTEILKLREIIRQQDISIKISKNYKICLDEIEEAVKNFNCENCKEFSRCSEKRTQSTNSIKAELSYLLPSTVEIDNKIMQMIPSPTRCDVALEKVIFQKIKEVKENEQET